ncbi:hypothetical protein [Kitasatospora sp. HPMI-4]|uniref:hypothetical protein n=1 Tax=Kitasatospora sp. HPMI-4 TaxID=3448443 RepID=UPI003F1DE82E
MFNTLLWHARALGERTAAELKQRWRALQHVTLSLSRIGEVARARAGPDVRLEMTFARRLHAHHRHCDARENSVTYLAQSVFQPCAGTPARTPADVSWPTPEETHLVLRGESQDCDWLCGYVEQATKGFETYAAEARV